MIKIVSCTTASTQTQISQLQITQCYKHFDNSGHVLELITNNKRGLPVVYNEVMHKHRTTPVHNPEYVDWLVFVHDDVYIDDIRLGEKLERAHGVHGFDVVGLAGCLNPIIKPHNLWHVMGERQSLRGHVAHPIGQMLNGEQQTTVTSFGPTPSRVVLIDGLFMAVKVESIRDNPWKFNENYTFHHYDISSCIDANRHKLKIGVYPINVMHTSPGLRSLDDTAWKTSNDRFLKEYGSQ